MGPLEYDVAPRPRVLVSRIDEAEAAALLDGLAPTHQQMSVERGLMGLRPLSWDVVISLEAPIDVAKHHRVVQFGGDPVELRVQRNTLQQIRRYKVWGAEVVLAEDVPSEFRNELKHSVIRAVRDTDIPRWAIAPPHQGHAVDYFIPLVTDADGNAFAAIYKPKGVAEEVLYLPDGVAPSRQWIALAFDRWSTVDTDAFPTAAQWTRRAEWMTADERAALGSVEKAERNLAEAVQRLEAELAEAQRVFEDRHTGANEKERLLLTASGAELVKAVEKSLGELGFDVENRDEVATGEKLEDLRVRDSDWTAISEVKGYKGGASTTDIVKLQRFSKAYQRETGKFPDAQWLIVNQFREKDPSTRQLIFTSQDSDVEAFADDDGVAMDTTALFRLHKDVAEGSIQPEDARAMLRDARGRFVYPEPPTPTSEAQING
ncbi:hypothetical protein A5662_12205 [Mycobacteriaceae bacterium 1482268.1]|nr:hypothetical protein A5662_12205 [Mycobacteriaceae bacterium 1482268.1]